MIFLRGWIFVLFIAAGLLIFGCVGGATEQQTGGTTTQTTTTTTEPTEPTTTEPAATPETTEPTTEEPKPPEETVGGDLDLDDKTFLELAALGVPIACDITTTYQGITTTGTIYMVGEDKFRYEMPYDGGVLITIKNNEDMWTSNIMADMYPQCKWIHMTEEEVEGTTGTGEPMYETIGDLEEIPDTDFECRAWAYQDSMFTAPTDGVCTMDEWNDAIMASIPQ